ncbi:hypothetical protein OG923_33415 (plasmid) [Streptomyces halstedii]|uniref:hypothetical protein n=1 Tax=Streptomyces halstedii TaxID=1944 RepID=UPI00324C3D07
MDFHRMSAHGPDGDHDQAPHAEVVAFHAKGRSPCPLTGDDEHRHDRGRPLDPQCAALGGRNGYGVLCRCGTLLDSGRQLAAIEDKAEGGPDGAARRPHRDDLDDAAWDGRGIPLPAEDDWI